jgi:hypothetical protein
MYTKLKNRFRRAPAFALCVVLLAGVLSAALCGLQAANNYEQKQYEIMWETTPVKLVVTNLSATRRDNLGCPSFVFQAFNTPKAKNNLTEYVKDVQMKATLPMDQAEFGGEFHMGGAMIGITDPEISGNLYSAGIEQIKWLPGYDASILHESKEVCLIPESWLPEGTSLTEGMTVTCDFSYTSGPAGASITYEVTYPLTVVGTHHVSDSRIYCPLKTVQRLFSKVGRPLALDSIQATLVDNDLQDEVREASKAWFAEPNPTGAKTPWDYSWYFYYLYALDIENDQLVNAERTLKTSVLVNQICAFLLFVLSAGASFFAGFLMIRQRKREISLMRTLGTPNWKILLEFAAEQLLCLLAGTIVGGLFFLWQPIQRLGLFVLVYALGLCAALVIFLNSNLLTNLKEAE